jgi:hypothetical protein
MTKPASAVGVDKVVVSFSTEKGEEKANQRTKHKIFLIKCLFFFIFKGILQIDTFFKSVSNLSVCHMSARSKTI